MNDVKKYLFKLLELKLSFENLKIKIWKFKD